MEVTTFLLLKSLQILILIYCVRMAKNYDNWEKLVGAVMRREQLRRIAMNPSRNPSSNSSPSSTFSSDSQISESFMYNQHNLQLFAAYWQRFLTSDDHQIISDSPYLRLFLDERTGKKCFIVGARELQIAWGDTPNYWKWTSNVDSRFPEVAQLESVWWLDIRGKIKTRMLSPDTIYTVVLVFKLAEKSRGFKSVNTIVRFVDCESDKEAERRALIAHLQPAEDIIGQTTVSRDDGWMEVEIGKFYIREVDDGEVEGRSLEKWFWKTGLIVEGIEFRPTYSNIPFVLKKHVRGMKGKGKGRGRSVFPSF